MFKVGDKVRSKVTEKVVTVVGKASYYDGHCEDIIKISDDVKDVWYPVTRFELVADVLSIDDGIRMTENILALLKREKEKSK